MGQKFLLHPKELSITNDVEIKKGAGIFLHGRILLHFLMEIVLMILGMPILYTYIREKLKFTQGLTLKRVTVDL